MAKKRTSSIVGTWHIYEMEQWDEDYFNMKEASSSVTGIGPALLLAEPDTAIADLR